MAFSKQEELRLIELVRENSEKLFGTGLFANGSSIRKKAWDDITLTINAENATLKRTTEQIKKKWYNTKSSAKAHNAEIKKSRSMTGGGPQPETLTSAEEAVVDFLGDTPSFSGIQGFDSLAVADDSVLKEISDFAKENTSE